MIRALPAVPEARLLVAGKAGRGPAARWPLPKGWAGACVPGAWRERLASFFRAADYTVLYSGYEGLSHVLLESLQAGTPVIASDKGGNPEIVVHGRNGLLVPYVSVDALAETLRAALSGETRAQLAAHSGDGLERFTWATLVAQTVAVLEDVCTS